MWGFGHGTALQYCPKWVGFCGWVGGMVRGRGRCVVGCGDLAAVPTCSTPPKKVGWWYFCRRVGGSAGGRAGGPVGWPRALGAAGDPARSCCSSMPFPPSPAPPRPSFPAGAARTCRRASTTWGAPRARPPRARPPSGSARRAGAGADGRACHAGPACLAHARQRCTPSLLQRTEVQKLWGRLEGRLCDPFEHALLPIFYVPPPFCTLSSTSLLTTYCGTLECACLPRMMCRERNLCRAESIISACLPRVDTGRRLSGPAVPRFALAALAVQ